MGRDSMCSGRDGPMAGFGRRQRAATVSALCVLIAGLCAATAATAAVGAPAGATAAVGSGAPATGADLGRLADGDLCSGVRHHDHPVTCPTSGDHHITHHPLDPQSAHHWRSATGRDTGHDQPAAAVRSCDAHPDSDPGGAARQPAVHGWGDERSDGWNGGERSGGSIVTPDGDRHVADGRRDSLMWNAYDGRPGSGCDADHRCRRHRGCCWSQ